MTLNKIMLEQKNSFEQVFMYSESFLHLANVNFGPIHGVNKVLKS